MTNLYKRRYLSDMPEQNFKLVRKYNYDLSVIILDIDRFKKINDTYGHSVGDKVIIVISEILLESARSSDIVSRYGGEEFLILLPQTTLEYACAIAKRIKSEIEEKSIWLEDEKEFNATVSISISEISNLDKNIENTINRTDKALYRAKKSGRNKVCIY